MVPERNNRVASFVWIFVAAVPHSRMGVIQGPVRAVVRDRDEHGSDGEPGR